MLVSAMLMTLSSIVVNGIAHFSGAHENECLGSRVDSGGDKVKNETKIEALSFSRLLPPTSRCSSRITKSPRPPFDCLWREFRENSASFF